MARNNKYLKKKKKKVVISTGRMMRYKTISISEVLLMKLVRARPLNEILVEGYPIDVDTDRYESLYINGWKCAHCGREVSFAAIEKGYGSKGKYHINFYAIDEETNKEICMTKDHIYPRILGGFDNIHNYQTLCEQCNSKKKDQTDLSIDEAVAAGYTSYERVAMATQILEEQAKLVALESAAAAQRSYVNQLKSEFGMRDKSEFIRG